MTRAVCNWMIQEQSDGIMLATVLLLPDLSRPEEETNQKCQGQSSNNSPHHSHNLHDVTDLKITFSGSSYLLDFYHSSLMFQNLLLNRRLNFVLFSFLFELK